MRMDTLSRISNPENGWRMLSVGAPVLAACLLLGTVRTTGRSAYGAWSKYQEVLSSATTAGDMGEPVPSGQRSPFEEWAAIQARFNCQNNGSRILEEVGEHARALGLAIDGVAPHPEHGERPVPRGRLVSIDITGTFHQVVAFVHRIEQSERPMRTHRLDLSRPRVEAPLTAGITIETLCVETPVARDER